MKKVAFSSSLRLLFSFKIEFVYQRVFNSEGGAHRTWKTGSGKELDSGSGNKYSVHAQKSSLFRHCLRSATNQVSNALERLDSRRSPSLGFGFRHGCGGFFCGCIIWPVAAHSRESKFGVLAKMKEKAC